MKLFYIKEKKSAYKLDKSLFVLFCCVLSGCAKSDNLTALENADTKGDISPNPVEYIIYSDSTQNSCVVLSESRIANPYNVDTLRRAMALAYPKGHSLYSFSDITSTHYQIRFLPKNEEDFQLLDDSGIITTPIPLDRKIDKGGAFYFDPQLNPEQNPYTWQYSIVPVDKVLPDVEYEIIGQIRRIEPLRSRSIEDVFWTELKDKAYEMCGYEPENAYPSPAPRYVITGNIEVYDSKIDDYIGSIGARIVMTGLTYIETSDVQDWSGNYVIPRYIADDLNARAVIKWQNEEWQMFDLENDEDTKYKQAICVLPNQPAVWNIKIKGGKQEKFATVTRALHRIYYGNNLGLGRPYTLGGMRVLCVDIPISNGRWGAFSGKTIWVWASNADSYNKYRVAIHELGHSIETLCLGNKGYNWISESWSRLVENYITRLEYDELSEWYNIEPSILHEQTEMLPGGAGLPGAPGTLRPYNKPNAFNEQYWPFTYIYSYKLDFDDYGRISVYTPLLIDLVDSDNQREYYRLHNLKSGENLDMYKSFPDDKVKGYTLPQIALAYSKLNFIDNNLVQLKEFKEIIKTVRPNTQTQKIQIDTLINKYIYYCEKYYK